MIPLRLLCHIFAPPRVQATAFRSSPHIFRVIFLSSGSQIFGGTAQQVVRDLQGTLPVPGMLQHLFFFPSFRHFICFYPANPRPGWGKPAPRLSSALARGEEPAPEITQISPPLPERKSIVAPKNPEDFHGICKIPAASGGSSNPSACFPLGFFLEGGGKKRFSKPFRCAKNHLLSPALSSELPNRLGSFVL